MKASLWGQARYVGRLAKPREWPIPPGDYDLEAGQQSYEAVADLLEMGDELGYDWVSFAEHHFTNTRLTPSPTLMASYMASRIKRARIALLGPLVATQNPVRIAEEVAMLDNLTGGRVVVGMLRGTPSEYQASGINPAETRARTQEGIELILKAWTEPKPFGWEGVYYRYRTVSVWPRPVQQPHPPAYALGTSMETAEFAAAHHMGLGISYEPLEFSAEQSRHYIEQCAAYGWTPGSDDIVYRGRVLVAENAAEAERYRALKDVPSGAHHVTESVRYVEAIESSRRSVAHYGKAPTWNFIGSPDEIVAQLREWHDVAGIGVVDLAFDPPPGAEYQDAAALQAKIWRSVELFGREVLPAMREI